jgi:nucleoid-associated protein YgaU
VSLVGSVVLLLAGVLSQVATATAGAWADVAAPGPARPEDVVGALAGTAALVLVVWLMLAVVVSFVAAVVPRAVPLGRLLAPSLVRHLVAALVGVAIVATPARADTVVTCPPAGAAGRPVVVADAVAEASVPPLDPGWLPTAPVSPAVGADLSPGWLPTVPATQPVRREGADPSLVTAARRRTGVVLDEQVVVRRGDTLWSLSERVLGPAASVAQVAQLWPRWYSANETVLTGGPDHLLPGMRLTPPEMAPAADAPAATSPGSPR